MFLFALTLLPLVSTQITQEYNCTAYDDTKGFIWASQAVSCQNFLSDEKCADLFLNFPGGITSVAPEEGKNTSRPLGCYTMDNLPPHSVSDLVRQYAVEYCPRTCGYCCLTKSYNCINRYQPRIKCTNVTKAQCLSPLWRDVLTEDCPASCGFCEEKKQCVDLAPGCENDPGICSKPTMQDFVNLYCRKTCVKCQ